MGQPGGGEEVARIKALQDNAERLGLTWGIRPAEITSTDPVQALVDADTEPIGVIPMIGSLYVGQRVYIMRVPPSANYVVGLVVGDDTPPPIGTTVGWTAASGDSAAIGGETSILGTGLVNFLNGCAYEIDYEADVGGSVGGNFANFQIRRTSVAGTVVRANSGHPMSSVAGFGSTCKGSAIVKNTSGASIAFVAVLTLSSPLAGTVAIAGASNRLAFLRVRYIGEAADFLNATAL
jgi:hypothetical protein